MNGDVRSLDGGVGWRWNTYGEERNQEVVDRCIFEATFPSLGERRPGKIRDHL